MSNSHKRNQKGLAPGVRPSLRSGSLLPVPLRGPAATGHPWPIAALPASMPVDPLHRTSSRPPDGAVDQKQIKSRRGGRPDGASVCDAIFVAADERSEAASGCVATVKPGPGIHLSEPACEGRSLAGRVDRQQSINRGHINPRATPSTGWHSAPCVCQTLPHRPPSARPAPATAATTDAGATAGQRQSGTAPG